MTVIGTDKTNTITGGDYNQWKENQVDLFSFLGKFLHIFFCWELQWHTLKKFDSKKYKLRLTKVLNIGLIFLYFVFVATPSSLILGARSKTEVPQFLCHLDPTHIETCDDRAELEFIKSQILARRRFENSFNSNNVIYSTVVIWHVNEECLSLGKRGKLFYSKWLLVFF